MVWPAPSVRDGVVDWLRSNVPAARLRSVAAGNELPIKTRLPVPLLMKFVTEVPVNALSLLIIRELVLAMPKVALPVMLMGPVIIEVPLSLVTIPPFRTETILFSGNRLRAKKWSEALLRTVIVRAG